MESMVLQLEAEICSGGVLWRCLLSEGTTGRMQIGAPLKTGSLVLSGLDQKAILKSPGRLKHQKANKNQCLALTPEAS